MLKVIKQFLHVFVLAGCIAPMQALLPALEVIHPIAMLAQRVHDNNPGLPQATLDDDDRLCGLAYEELSCDGELLSAAFPALAEQNAELELLRMDGGDIVAVQMSFESALASTLLANVAVLRTQLVQLMQRQ